MKRLALVALTLLLGACTGTSDDDDVPSCAEGEVFDCPCGDGTRSTQTCQADGTLTACACGSADAGSDSGQDAESDPAEDLGDDVIADADDDVEPEVGDDVLVDTSNDAGSVDHTATNASLDAFFDDHGGRDAFPDIYVDVVESMLRIEDMVVAGAYADARTELDRVFAAYPLYDPIWWSGVGTAGTNVGTPVAYYGMRMLDEIVRVGLTQPAFDPIPTTLAIVMAECATGFRPTDVDLTPPGEEVTLSLDPALPADDFRILRDSFRIFQHYIWAITDGRLSLDLAFEVVDVCVPVSFREGFSGTDQPATVIENASAEIRESADMWMVLYPSNVPPDPAFDDSEFITGGMGGYGNGAPMFIADDLWVVRIPPHLGDGPYSDAERRVYLPQWVQHEFFHHLFRTWPEFGLEDEGHQWFDRGTWPDDFVGEWEPDYYAESLNKRLRDAEPPIHVALQTAPPSRDLLRTITQADLLGDYHRLPIDNDYHDVVIEEDGDGLWWRNAAGVRWSLTWVDGVLRAGDDCPYGAQDLGIALVRGDDGAFSTTIEGVYFLGELYTRQ